MPSMIIESLKSHARRLKAQTLTIYCAARDPRMPIYIRFLALLIAAYALSPIDLIPDFIPVIGYLDDLVLIPLGLALVVYLAPEDLMNAARLEAEALNRRPVSYAAAVIVIVVWLLLAVVVGRWLLLG